MFYLKASHLTKTFGDGKILKNSKFTIAVVYYHHFLNT